MEIVTSSVLQPFQDTTHIEYNNDFYGTQLTGEDISLSTPGPALFP